jgi:hypothetical protein
MVQSIEEAARLSPHRKISHATNASPIAVQMSIIHAGGVICIMRVRRGLRADPQPTAMAHTTASMSRMQATKTIFIAITDTRMGLISPPSLRPNTSAPIEFSRSKPIAEYKLKIARATPGAPLLIGRQSGWLSASIWIVIAGGDRRLAQPAVGRPRQGRPFGACLRGVRFVPDWSSSRSEDPLCPARTSPTSKRNSLAGAADIEAGHPTFRCC